MKIKKRKIGKRYPPFIIAEISGNHKGSLYRAKKLIKEAKLAGASAVKLQTFDLDEITINSNRREFFINDKNSSWNKRNLYSLYKESQTPLKWHKAIFEYCNRINLICFSSVFDLKSLAELKKLKSPAYKIASFEINHYPLIEEVAKTKKPTIISTGMSNLKEIIEVQKIFKKANNPNYAFLKCTSAYPANPSDSNINAIKTLKKIFNCEIGLSDHTLGIGCSVASISLGGTIIEKHLTLKKNDGSIDGHFSLVPEEFKNLVKECNIAWKSLGKNKVCVSKGEKKSLIFRRSIYVSKNLKKGCKINKNNIKVIRPSLGMHPKYYNSLIGRKLKKAVKKGTPFKKSMVY